MHLLLALLLSVSIMNIAPAEARKIKMTMGKDTKSFHTELNGKVVWTDDPHEDFVYRFGQMVKASLGLYHAGGIGVRQIDGYQNAYAVVNSGKRYVLFDANLWGNAGGGKLKEAVLYGHELGHHVCGHLQGALTDQGWQRELEADRFAGAAIRAVNDAGFGDSSENVDHDKLLQAVSDIFVVAGFDRGGRTHPPLNLRLAAFSEGWRNGSPCKERGVVSGPAEPDKDQIRKAELAFCNAMAKEFCSNSTDFEDKIHRQSLIQTNCKVSGPIVSYCPNPPCVGRFVVFPGVDCAGGGRFDEKALTKMPIPEGPKWQHLIMQKVGSNMSRRQYTSY